MWKRLSSPRFRRRVFWLAAVGLLVAAVAGAVALLPSSKKTPEVFTKAPPQVVTTPRTVPLDRNGRAQIVLVVSGFVKTAVRRSHVDASWDMTDPSLKQGFTRKQWATGDIPVVPYPAVAIRQLDVDWSYRDDVAFDIVLVAKAASHLPPKSFMIELKRHGETARDRWRVVSWAPHGVSEASAVASSDRGPLPKATSLSSRWLLLPLALLLGTLLALPVALTLRERVRVARSERAHRRSTRG